MRLVGNFPWSLARLHDLTKPETGYLLGALLRRYQDVIPFRREPFIYSTLSWEKTTYTEYVNVYLYFGWIFVFQTNCWLQWPCYCCCYIPEQAMAFNHCRSADEVTRQVTGPQCLHFRTNQLEVMGMRMDQNNPGIMNISFASCNDIYMIHVSCICIYIY